MFLINGEIFGQSFMFFKIVKFWGCERFGSFLHLLSERFNIVHTFVCGDDVGASTTNADKLISDGAVNVNSETKALTCAKFSAYVELSAYFYLYPEAIAGCDSFKTDDFCRKKSSMVLAYGFGLSIELINKTYIIKVVHY